MLKRRRRRVAGGPGLQRLSTEFINRVGTAFYQLPVVSAVIDHVVRCRYAKAVKKKAIGVQMLLVEWAVTALHCLPVASAVID